MNSNIARSVKDSGVNWIGQIPADWNTPKLRYLITKTNAGEVIDRSFWHDGDELLYTCQRTPMASRYPDFPSEKRTEPGDLLLTRNGTPYIHLPVPGSIYSNVVQRVRLTRMCNTKFMWYALSDAARNVSGYGDIIESFNMGVWKELVLPLPNPSEQQSIAAFLDKRVASIDSIIEKKQRLIELLQEKRQALITQAVTKGLDPSVPMKDSGIEWLGEIPAHWESVPLLVCLKENTIKNEGLAEDNVLSLSYGQIVPRDVESNFGLLPASFSTYQVVDPDNIVIRPTDLQNDKRSLRVGYVEQRGIITSAYIALERRERMLPKYAYYLLHTADIHKVFYNMGGGLRQSVRYFDLKWMPLIAPPVEEQMAIIKVLDQGIAILDATISKNQRLIELYQEYRQALISAAVTGKIDVREEVAACP